METLLSRGLNKIPLISALDDDGHTQGWTGSPNSRGTLDIIWGCFLTIFLCGWTTIALGQYMRARQSVRDFADAGCPGWTVRHGFFADMGGFVLHAPDFVPFPLNLCQVQYLVTHGYVDFGAVLIDKHSIEDKNKFDLFTRILTTVQLSWFVVNMVARAALGMALTTLELSTNAFIFCSLFTCYCWRDAR